GAGVPPTGSADRTARRCATSGERIAPSIAAESLSATAAGVPGGATIPTQVAETKPGSASDIAGTPGSEATRCSLHTATALSLPAFTCGSVTPRLSNMRSISPASSAAIAGADPLYGTCVILNPAADLNISAVRCEVVPLPCDP